MNSKNLVLGILGLGVIALAAYFFSADKKNEINIVTENSETKKTNTATDNRSVQMTTGGQTQTAQTKSNVEKKTDFRYMQERLDAMHERRPNMQFDPAEVAAAIDRDVAWKPLKEIPKELPLKPEEFTDGREFISLDSLKIETLMPGDRVKVPIKALGREYEVTVDNVERHDYNSISWNGHIDGGDGRNYNATFTRGESLTVGGIDTPDGQYELQAHGSNGWIASANELFKNHVDPIDPNTIVPGSVPVRDHSTSEHSHTH